jgi:NAD(P)-dependent dehydrogenase (short-subunit alcohol dehydrogenase family)
MPTLTLTNKVAIVTGAAQGIGKGIATRLAQEGASVVIADVQADAATQAASELPNAIAHAIDLADASQPNTLVEQIVASFDRLDILINCAGIMHSKPMLDLTPADVDRMIAINQRGLFFMLQAAARQMIAQARPDVRSNGKIVNIASIAAYAPRPMALHYGMTKAAVISITRSAAMALAPHAINVNAVCPGTTPTAMWAEMAQAQGHLRGLSADEMTRQMAASIPLRRLSTIEDIAGAVAFLCGPDSDTITGQALHVDGGMVMD